MSLLIYYIVYIYLFYKMKKDPHILPLVSTNRIRKIGLTFYPTELILWVGAEPDNQNW